jgi:hypothetical protein
MPRDTQLRVEVSKLKLSRVSKPVEYTAIVGLALLFAWKGIWAGWRALGTDFGQYYMGARLFTEHCKLDRLYDWIWLQRSADRHGVSHQLVGYLGLTPFSVFPLLPLAWLPILPAKHIWMVLNLFLLIGVVWLLSKITGLLLRRSWLIALLAVIPLRNNFAFGQMHLVVLVLLVAAWCFHMRGKQVASGCCIALAGALKIYPLFFCLYFLVKRRWHALGAVALVSAGCLGLCWVSLGSRVTTAFLFEQLPRSLNGESGGPFVVVSTSAAVMFHRIFLFEPEANPHPLISSPFLYAAFYSLWQALLTGLVVSRLRPQFHPDERETIEWCAFLTLLMFLSSAPATYHFVVLIGTAIPTYAILEKTRPRVGWLLLAVYVIACNARNIASGASLPTALSAILVPRLWAGVGLIAIYATVLLWRWPGDEESASGSLRAPQHRYYFPRNGAPAAFGAVVGVLWLSGTATAWTHLRVLDSDNSRKLGEADHAWMRAAPQVTARGIYYVAMRDTDYTVMRDGAPVHDLPAGDELSYAVDRDGRQLWIETASSRGSVIAEVEPLNDGRVSCEIENAESPALSQDGDSLAFIREDRGSGSLWIADPHDCGSQYHAVRVTPAYIDVRSVSGAPQGQFAFVGLTKQGSAVFLVSRAGKPEPLLQPGTDVDSAAFSSDGQTLIVSERINRQLQLVSYGLDTHNVRQFTFGNCNATTPSWKDANKIVYATDCERGMGLTTLAEIDLRR